MNSARRVVRRVAVAAIAVGCALALAGCGNITLATPTVMTINSGAFLRGTIMPSRFTCADSKAVNPPIGWGGTPKGTKSLALVMDDSNAPITPYVYWIVFNINPASSYILEGQLPPGARQALNSAGTATYDAPCPGHNGHGYRFTVYALNSVLQLPNGASLEKTWMAIAGAAIGRGRLPFSATS